ncbi:MAG: hypothetical protein ACLRM0_15745, partial [[Clostridium] leptum]
MQILRPGSAGFPQNLERVAVAGRLLPCPPACQKGFFDKQKNAAFRRCRVLLQIYLVIPERKLQVQVGHPAVENWGFR